MQERQLAEKENEEPEQSKTKEAPVSLFDAEDLREMKEIASKFTYMSNLWIRNLKQTFKLDVDKNYKPENWFNSFETRAQGVLLELHEVIPQKWHVFMGKTQFRTLVSV